MEKILEKLQVLEIPGSRAGGYASSLFARQGAQITKWDSGCSLEGNRGRALLAELENTDILIESASPEPLPPAHDLSAFPQLIHLRISPFGSGGAYAGYRSNAFTDDAFGGHLYLNGESHREPFARPGAQALIQAALHGFIGALAALRAREMLGRGQSVEVSHLEGLVSMHQHTLSMWSHGGRILRREGHHQPGPWHPGGIYACQDGHVLLHLGRPEHRDHFLALADLPEIVLDPRFADELRIAANKTAFDAAIRPFFAERKAEDVVSLLQSEGLPAAEVTSYSKILTDLQLEKRQFWSEEDGLRVPGGGIRISVSQESLEENNSRADHSHPRAGTTAKPQPPALPLDGIRILDLSRLWAGPFASRLLADLGADVIGIEAPMARGSRSIAGEFADQSGLYPDNELGAEPWNRVGSINKLLRNKRSLTLDLKRPEAKAIFKKWVRKADVVLENFSPGFMENLGLDFETLRALNPRVIHASISGYGITGARRHWVALGPVIEAQSGMLATLGYPDAPPYRSGVAWADPMAGLHAAAGILLAVEARRRDRGPRARQVEISMLESLLSTLAPELALAQRESESENENEKRLGNRHPQFAPQGIYPCRGDDRWLAISIMTDPQWRALCTCAGLGLHLEQLSREERRAAHDDIDREIALWTRTGDRTERLQTLQRAGVIAGPVNDARDLALDSHLGAQGFWWESNRAETGQRREPGCAIRMSATRPRQRHRAPRLGEHNRELLREIPGLSEDELLRLEREGILVSEPPH